MDLFQLLPLAFKAMKHRKDIDAVTDMLEPVVEKAGPALEELRRIWPDLWPRVQTLLAVFFPNLRLDIADSGGISFSTEWLQETLNAHFGEKLTVDGDYGDATNEAVKRFQAKYMSPEDVTGWADFSTLLRMFDEMTKDKAKKKK